MKKHLLIIDDDVNFCLSLQDYFSSDQLKVSTAHSGREGIAVCREHPVDIVILDEHLPDGEGHFLCKEILVENNQAKIIFITAYPSFEHAIQALKAGADDYISKPVHLDEIGMAIHRILKTMRLENVRLLQDYKTRQDRLWTSLIGDTDAWKKIRGLIDQAAGIDSPVLLTGETGTGKNIAAQTIHQLSNARESPYISVNCTALPDNLVESELFGYERGAFTGATASRKGLFEIAESGTLFLDEIGAMPVHLQSKLLGVLDDWKIRRLGGRTDIPVQVRIITATNSDLERKIEEKTFRQDLYYRINVMHIHLPPLRDRIADIPALCRHFIEKIGKGRIREIPDNELHALMEYDWPGNIRELRNIIERSLILHGEALHPSELLGKRTAASASAPDTPGTDLTLQAFERKHIEHVWNLNRGNLAQTSKALGISLSTLKRKARQFGLR